MVCLRLHLLNIYCSVLMRALEIDSASPTQAERCRVMDATKNGRMNYHRRWSWTDDGRRNAWKGLVGNCFFLLHSSPGAPENTANASKLRQPNPDSLFGDIRCLDPRKGAEIVNGRESWKRLMPSQRAANEWAYPQGDVYTVIPRVKLGRRASIVASTNFSELLPSLRHLT